MTKVIKRYANRKLYDTEQSTYVTLDEIEQMVKNGEDIQIIDNSSKDDITHVTLAHIIFEQEKSNKSQLPVSALRGIIQSGEEFIQRLQSPVTQFKDEFRKRAEVVGEGSRALREFVDSTQQSIDERQRRMDDRLRDAFDQLTHIPELKTDTQRLEARVGELERTILRLEHSLMQMQPHRDVTSSDPHRDVPNTDTHFR
ncbi:MAG: polyhydroxyalkanoate synthesis regulator DNA-binding domain-containing protein [Myxococcota bacterium]|nr:polyhydroxyalkanoate synthesis regulator DNA-binding domain-containing protein [Myxococcota bacterium]